MPNYNYYPTYTPYSYGQPQMQQPTYQQAPAPQPQSGIIWVQGEAGAKAYPVAAGSNVLLMDSEDKCFYIKSTDPSGMPLPLRVFEYSEVAKTEPIIEQSHAALPDFQQFAKKEDLQALEEKIDSLSKNMQGQQKQRIERKEKEDGK